MGEQILALRKIADDFPESVAIEHLGQTTTYSQLVGSTDRRASELEGRGSAQGSRVALVAHGTVQFVVEYFAIQATGAIPVLFDPRVPNGVVADVMEKYGILSIDDFKNGARGNPALTNRPATEVCRLTSGSTGLPKALEYSGATVVRAASTWSAASHQLPTDRVLCLAPLANGLGFNVAMMPTLLKGGTLVLFNGIQTPGAVSRQIAASKITRLVAAPAFYNLFAENPIAQALNAKLSMAISAAAPLDPEVRRKFRKSTGTRLIDYFGVAETGPVTFEPDEEVDDGLGLPLPGADIRIANDGSGELLVSTSWMSSGYLDDATMFESRIDAEGYFHSRDIASFINGRLHISGRMDGLVNVAGSKFDPEKVSGVVRKLSNIRDAHCLAAKNESGASELVLYVAAEKKVGREDIVSHCREFLPAYMIPARINFVDSIPRNGVGKALFSELTKHSRSDESHVA